MRPSQRLAHQLRNIRLTRNYTHHAEGSVLVEFGETRVLCTASVISGVPRFLKDSRQGWLTAEYGMLPRATHTRTDREASRGRQGGRTLEIQRLIGRSLRSAVDLKALGDYTITIDCDVLQADGGTRTAAITGGCVALFDALVRLSGDEKRAKALFKGWVAAVSVGIYQGEPILDLDYTEDSQADMDMNVVMTESGMLLEVQGTAEKAPFSRQALQALLDLAAEGANTLIAQQKALYNS